MRIKYLVIPAMLSFGTALYSTLLPLVTVKYGGGVTEYALINISYCLSYALGSWVLPTVLRGLHRKVALMVCSSLTFSVALITGLLNNPYLIVLIQVPYALLIALSTVIQTNIFAELWRGGKGVTLLYVASSIGWIASLLIGSFLRGLGVCYLHLFALSSIGFLVASLTSVALPRTVGVIEAQKVLSFKSLYRWVIERVRLFNPLALPKPVMRIRRLASLKVFLISTYVVYASIGLYFTVLPIYLKKVVMIDDATFIALSAVAGTSSLTLYLMQLRISENVITLWQAHIVALTARVVLFAIPPLLVSSKHLYYLLYASLGATWAFVGSVQSIITSKLAPPRRKDELVGTMNALMSAGLATGFMMSTVVNTLNYQSAFIMSSVLIATSIIINYKALKLYEAGLI